MSEMQGAAAAPARSEKGMGAFTRIVDIFVDPKPAFADIGVRPRWWIPVLLLMIVSAVYMAAFTSHVGWERLIRQTAESSPQLQNMPADQRENAIAMQVKFAAPFGITAAILATPVGMLIVGGIMLFVFSVMMSAKLTYQQALGVVSYASLPNVLATAAFILVMLLKAPDDFDLRNPAGFNLGFYLDPHSSPAWLVSLGSSIDIFSIWVLLLLATGFSVVTKKSWKSSLMGVMAPWALYVVGKVAIAAIRGQ